MHGKLISTRHFITLLSGFSPKVARTVRRRVIASVWDYRLRSFLLCQLALANALASVLSRRRALAALRMKCQLFTSGPAFNFAEVRKTVHDPFIEVVEATQVVVAVNGHALFKPLVNFKLAFGTSLLCRRRSWS
jgi:hypothetical protein